MIMTNGNKCKFEGRGKSFYFKKKTTKKFKAEQNL